ncbi:MULTISPECIES: sugar ABC transporter permease [Microbacterium]|uniref:Sugar ABC transporter permease n=1 Tax=Microbacterium binotii TaxID=462710 RepID=A0ABP6BS48_9MICO|nr:MULTISPECIES: ABC transporter permease subunit [unclassified Microbacterium]MDQ1206366.1 arabinogalactan oligomer/maltooligosaccharide transport system permease protein [Microbacterium sp. SORGH_AS_0862]MDR6200997.1 arabinogalactan oligomer/maltooligosaccharide transport system permease protein [Microbacterium sp. SORGH_AS_0428]MDY0828659.1 ABC transporter permease subunit [Microbacterium sp. BG28]
MSTARTRIRRRRWWLEVGWKYFFAAIVVFYAVFPLVYVLSAALNPRGTLSGSNNLFSAFDLSNFAALGATSYWTWVGNTLLVGGVSAVGAVIMGASAAYAFSRFRFRGRRVSLTSLLIVQMFPQALAFVAIFLMLLAIGEIVPALGLNSKLALICVYLGGALGANTFLMYGFFNTIPIEIDESAKIDGATHAQIFWRLIIPLVTPILAVVALLAFITAFGDYILAKIVLTSEDNWTLAVGMYQWVSNQLASRWGLFAAGAVIAAVPVLALFLSLQRFIVGGLTQGSVKG